jgi:hypothetical protein
VHRAVWVVLLLVLIGLTSSCGDKGGTSTDQGDQVPTGWFTCSYKRGEALGASGCRADYQVHSYKVTMDWWTDVPEKVDSVIFWVPSDEAIWTEATECLTDEFAYRKEKGTRDANHWRLDHLAYGHVSHHPLTNLWLSLEFTPDSLAEAQVYFGNGLSVTFEAEPGTE